MFFWGEKNKKKSKKGDESFFLYSSPLAMCEGASIRLPSPQYFPSWHRS